MRAHEFKFKKTVKRVQEFAAISIDLTVLEAKELLGLMDEGGRECTQAELDAKDYTPAEEAMGDLEEALEAFVAKHE